MITPIIRTPITVPVIFPTPPDKLVPPINAAAMASNSYATHAFGCPVVILEARIIPAKAAKAEQTTYVKIFTASILIPEAFAAFSFPPTA